MTIKQIQHLLAFLGYYQGGVDGIWGEGSAKACREFQKDFGGIGVDGIPGKDTQKALRHAVSFGIPEREDDPKEEKPQDEEVAFWASVPNFDPVEFECHCGCGLNNADHRLVLLCQKVRDHFNAPFIISSPCRCEANNRKAGGVWNSRHLFGRAVDFCIRGKSAAQILSYLKTLPEVAYCYAIDGSYVHMDIL